MVKKSEDEDFTIKRRIAVEARGLSLNSWFERNLNMITKVIKNWGWWLNDPEAGCN